MFLFILELYQINGKVSLGLSNGVLKNAHIYSKDAVTLDGVGRICYIQREENTLIISEYFGNRGAKYSSGFKELTSRLRNASIKENQMENLLLRN